MAIVNGKSGTFNIYSKNDSISGYVKWQETYDSSTYLSTNQSTVTLTAYLRRTNSWDGDTWFTGYTMSRTAYFGSNTVSSSTTTLSIPPGGTYVEIFKANYVINHDSDGKKSITVGIATSLSKGSDAVQRAFTISKTTATITLTHIYSNVKAGTIAIKDNGNNTFTITATKGGNGVHNTASGPFVYFSFNSATYGYSTALIDGAVTVDIPAGTTHTVYAKCVTKGAQGDTAEKTVSKEVKYYAAPGNPGKPYISTPSGGERLTVKQPWTFSWISAKAGNANSNIAGYRLRLFVNGKNVPIKNYYGFDISSYWVYSDGRTDYTYDTNSTSNSFIIYPLNQGIKARDVVHLSIYAYTTNGAGTQLWSGNGKNDIVSDTYTVENAGVVHVKVNAEWREGQVFVKVNDTWHEADTVYVKTDGSWKESQ